MMKTMSTLSDDDRANLTAYLDGELDEETAQALEAKLSQDPNARAEVEALRQAWTMLDYLPRSAPSATFTHRTMERLSLERRPVETGKMPAGRAGSWFGPVAWAAAMVLAAWIGWYASQRLWQPTPDPDEALVRQLRLIEKWRAYEMVDDVEFLRALDDPDLFGEDVDS
jgi:anti-sigma factor RsiW